MTVTSRCRVTQRVRDKDFQCVLAAGHWGPCKLDLSNTVEYVRSLTENFDIELDDLHKECERLTEELRQERLGGGPVFRAAMEWWRMHRPVTWDVVQHLANPSINCVTPTEKALAEAVAARFAAITTQMQAEMRK